MDFNDKQLKVINASDEAIFLLSGAGTGKTSVMIARLLHILSKNTKKPNILVLSFTRSSVYDVKRKLPKMVDNVLITTFHSLCYRIVSLTENIKMINDNYQSLIDIDNTELTHIQRKKQDLDFMDVTTMRNNAYSMFLDKNGLIDYTDLEIRTMTYLQNHALNRQDFLIFDYIFIDEFQDTSNMQFQLLKLLKSAQTKIFAVGDPDQSIYTFRGTGKQVISDYINTYQAKVYLMDMNYRSSKSIIYHANHLISKNKRTFKKMLIPSKPEVGSVKSIITRDANSEISLIISNISKLIKSGYSTNDIAILYRNHSHASKLKSVLFNLYIGGLNLLTFHQSKGLEFKIVFIIGVCCPRFETKEDLEEERRLMFVAMTRAKEQLYIFSPVGKEKPSIFLKDAKIKNETLD